MIKKDLRRMILPIMIMAALGIMPMLSAPAQAVTIGPFFSISILAPNSNPARNQWATLMVEQLPKIGIEVDIFDHTSWSQIYPRTWDYPGPYPIPSYAEGGYDILFVGWGWGLDWDPTGLFDTPGIVPNGDNFYQYSSQEMDDAIGNYTASFITADRIEYAEDIQALLYEDLPQITIIYPRSLYPMNEDFEGWDSLLWASTYQPMENWSVGTETDFHYGVPADFVDFHIYQYESVYDAYWLRQIYNGLVERQPGTRQWGNRLATSFTSTDGLEWLVDINPNAKWADGSPLTASDVNYSYNLLIDPLFGNNDLAYWQQYIDETSITIINDYQVQINFLQPYVFQESNLAVDLVPEHIWGPIAPELQEAQAITWAVSDPTKLFGAGPYKMVEYDGTNQVIHLEVNEYFDDWSGVTPNFDDIFFEFYANKEGAISALATGALDMVDSQFSCQIEEISDLPGVVYELVEDPGTQEMGINMEHPYLGTGASCPIATEASANHIRKAISHMIPRDVIVEEILDGIGAPGVTAMPDVAIGFDTSLVPYEYSLELALDHMEAAGFDIPDIPTLTAPSGIGLAVLMSILALAGASQVFFLKRRK
ncbi:MAG: ABC transporter substrate-binding protein [Candidatus Heimdallarchaeota archaeon]